MTGHAYDLKGEESARWSTKAVAPNPADRKLFYYWTGGHPREPNDTYEGVGEITFGASKKQFEKADGFFSNSNLNDLKSTTKKSFKLQRATESDIAVMESKDDEKISQFVRKMLKRRG